MNAVYQQKKNKYMPIRNLGCQSEPDDYEAISLQNTTENNLGPQDVQDRVLGVFLRIILTNPHVESFYIKTRLVVSNWPDEWGGTREIKKLTGERKSESKPEGLTEVTIELLDESHYIEGWTQRKIATNYGCSYIRNGIKVLKGGLFPQYWQEIKDEFVKFRKDPGINQLCIKIFERNG